MLTCSRKCDPPYFPGDMIIYRENKYWMPLSFLVWADIGCPMSARRNSGFSWHQLAHETWEILTIGFSMSYEGQLGSLCVMTILCGIMWLFTLYHNQSVLYCNTLTHMHLFLISPTLTHIHPFPISPQANIYIYSNIFPSLSTFPQLFINVVILSHTSPVKACQSINIWLVKKKNSWLWKKVNLTSHWLSFKCKKFDFLLTFHWLLTILVTFFDYSFLQRSITRSLVL